jgi:hypothetical protein
MNSSVLVVAKTFKKDFQYFDCIYGNIFEMILVTYPDVELDNFLRCLTDQSLKAAKQKCPISYPRHKNCLLAHDSNDTPLYQLKDFAAGESGVRILCMGERLHGSR